MGQVISLFYEKSFVGFYSTLILFMQHTCYGAHRANDGCKMGCDYYVWLDGSELRLTHFSRESLRSFLFSRIESRDRVQMQFLISRNRYCYVTFCG